MVKSRRVLTLLLSLFFVLLSRTSAATDVRLALGFDGQVAVPTGRSASQLPGVGGGGQIDFAIGLRAIPLLVGISAGSLTLDSSRTDGGVEVVSTDGGLLLTTTHIERSTELRHLELTLRLQPAWRYVRPFVDGSFGVAALWQTASLTGAESRTLADAEKQVSAAPAYSVGLGLDIDLWRLQHDEGTEHSSLGIVLTLGLRSFHTGPLDMAEAFVSTDRAWFDAEPKPIHLWMPYVGLSLAFDGPMGRPTTRESPSVVTSQ